MNLPRSPPFQGGEPNGSEAGWLIMIFISPSYPSRSNLPLANYKLIWSLFFYPTLVEGLPRIYAGRKFKLNLPSR